MVKSKHRQANSCMLFVMTNKNNLGGSGWSESRLDSHNDQIYCTTLCLAILYERKVGEKYENVKMDV